MKFLLAVAAHLVVGLVLAYGILLAVKGQPMLLIAGFLTYLVAFVALGCLPRQSH